MVFAAERRVDGKTGALLARCGWQPGSRGRRRMSTNVRKRWKPPGSENAASASPAPARLPRRALPCPALPLPSPALPSPLLRPTGAQRAAVRCAVRSPASPPCPAVRAAQPRAGSRVPPGPAPQNGEGRAGPVLFWRYSVAGEGAAPGPAAAFPVRRAGASPVCERQRGAPAGGARPGRRGGEPHARESPSRSLGSLVGGSRVGGGRRREGAPRQGGRRGAPAPAPRRSAAAVTYGSVCEHAPCQQGEKHRHSKP